MKSAMSSVLSILSQGNLDSKSQNLSRMQNDSEVISVMTPSQVMRNLTKQHQTILNKMSELDQLNINFQEKQEKQFLKAFLNIMDRMSNQLIEYQEKIRDIDQQIARDQKCVALAKQMNFFRNQCLQLRKIHDSIEGDILQQRMKNEILQQRQKQRNQELFHKSKKFYKYKARANSLQFCYLQNTAIEDKQMERKIRTAQVRNLHSQTPGKQMSGTFSKQPDFKYKTATISRNRTRSVRHSVQMPSNFFLSRNRQENSNFKQNGSQNSQYKVNKSVDRKLNY